MVFFFPNFPLQNIAFGNGMWEESTTFGDKLSTTILFQVGQNSFNLIMMIKTDGIDWAEEEENGIDGASER